MHWYPFRYPFSIPAQPATLPFLRSPGCFFFYLALSFNLLPLVIGKLNVHSETVSPATLVLCNSFFVIKVSTTSIFHWFILSFEKRKRRFFTKKNNKQSVTDNIFYCKRTSDKYKTCKRFILETKKVALSRPIIETSLILFQLNC